MAAQVTRMLQRHRHPRLVDHVYPETWAYLRNISGKGSLLRDDWSAFVPKTRPAVSWCSSFANSHDIVTRVEIFPKICHKQNPADFVGWAVVHAATRPSKSLSSFLSDISDIEKKYVVGQGPTVSLSEAADLVRCLSDLPSTASIAVHIENASWPIQKMGIRHGCYGDMVAWSVMKDLREQIVSSIQQDPFLKVRLVSAVGCEQEARQYMESFVELCNGEIASVS